MRNKSLTFSFLALSLVVLLSTGVFAELGVNANGLAKIRDSSIKIDARAEGKANVNSEGNSGNVRVNSETRANANLGVRSEGDVSVSLDVQRKISQDGNAEFVLTIKDKHESGEYTYQIDVVVRKGASVELEEEEVTLEAGSSEEVSISLESGDKGAYPFTVRVIGEDSRAAAVKGLLVNSEFEMNSSSGGASYFVGKGFTISEENESGEVVMLSLLKFDNEIRGKISVDKKPYKVEGVVSGDSLTLSILEINSGDVKGSFSGEIDRYENFILLKGDLTLDGESSELSAQSNRMREFRQFEIGVREKINARMHEVLALRQANASADSEVYLRPIGIEKAKILGFIPNPWGKKVVEVEFVDGEKVMTKTIKANSRAKFGNYSVLAGDLNSETEGELELEIEAQ